MESLAYSSHGPTSRRPDIMRAFRLVAIPAALLLLTPLASADLVAGETKTYVTSAWTPSPCYVGPSIELCTLPNGACLIYSGESVDTGAACFDAGAFGSRLSIRIDDVSGLPVFGQWTFYDAAGIPIAGSTFCGSTVTSPVPAATHLIGVLVHAQYSVLSCTSAGGTVGTITVKAV